MYFEGPGCVVCHESCLTCSQGTDTACTSCVADKLLIDGECTDEVECPDGQYLFGNE